MSISQELIVSLFVQLIILAFFVGIYVATIKFMGREIEGLKQSLLLNKKEINDSLLANKRELNAKLDADRNELKDEMKKYNNVLERMIITEQSTKSAHKRLDIIEGR